MLLQNNNILIGRVTSVGAILLFLLIISTPSSCFTTQSGVEKFVCRTFSIPEDKITLCWGDFHREAIVVYKVLGEKHWLSSFAQITNSQEILRTTSFLQERTVKANVDFRSPTALYSFRDLSWTAFVVENECHSYLVFFSMQCL